MTFEPRSDVRWVVMTARRRWSGTALVLATAAGTILPACAGGDESGTSATDDATETSDVALTPAPETSTHFEVMLARLPASAADGDGENSILTYADYSLVWDELDVGDDSVSSEDRLARLKGADVDVRRGSPLSQLFEPVPALDEARAETGMTAFDLEREIALVNAPSSIVVAQTRVEPAAIDDAVRTDPMWSQDLEEVDYGGATYYSWGDGRTGCPIASRPCTGASGFRFSCMSTVATTPS